MAHQRYEIIYPDGDYILWSALRGAIKTALMALSPDRDGIDRILGEKWLCSAPIPRLDFMLPGTRGLSEDAKAYYEALLLDLPPLTKGMTAEATQQFLDAYRAHADKNGEREPWVLHPIDIAEFKLNVDREIHNYEAQINKEIKEGRLTGRQMSASLFPYVQGKTLHLDPLSQLPREPIIRCLEVLGFSAAGPAVETTTIEAESSSIRQIPSPERCGETNEESAVSPPLKTKMRDDAVRRLMKEIGNIQTPNLDCPSLLEFSSQLLQQMTEKVEQGTRNRLLGVWGGNLYCTRQRNPVPWPDRAIAPPTDWTLIDLENVRGRLVRLAEYSATASSAGDKNSASLDAKAVRRNTSLL